jgi:hypothetical protein
MSMTNQWTLVMWELQDLNGLAVGTIIKGWSRWHNFISYSLNRYLSLGHIHNQGPNLWPYDSKTLFLLSFKKNKLM